VLNAAWTPVFFGAQQIAAAFFVIIALWVVLAWTVRRFFPLSTVAGWLLVPYLLWVTYAAVLNGALWVLN
jgi:tryptophan-rich sensory protein